VTGVIVPAFNAQSLPAGTWPRSVEAMRVLRPWIAIPTIAVVAGVIGGLTTRSALVAAAAGLLGAALAAAIRAFVGSTGPAAIAAAAGAGLGVLGWLELGADTRGAFAGAAAMFAICELVRPRVPIGSPWPAVGAGMVAAVLDPSYAALLAVTAAWLVASPTRRPRWVVVLPMVGALVAVVAVLAACAHGGRLARLEAAWSGHPRLPIDAVALVRAVGDRLGPLASVAALAGIVQCATRGRFAAAAILGVLGFAGLDAFARGAADPALLIVAALGAGVALGRLAALIRLSVGQAFVGAAAGFVLVAVPAWMLVVGR
jgi:hypothetical protein